MKNKKIVSVLLSSLITFSLFGCGEIATISTVKKASVGEPLPVYKYTYGLLDEDTMPIVMFGGPTHGYVMNGYKPDTMINDNTYRYYQEAGVNGIVGTANWVNGNLLDEVSEILKYTEKYRINYVTFDTSLIHFRSKAIPSLSDPAIQERLAFYEQYESFAGIYCQDEAKVEWLDELGKAHQFVFDYNEQNNTNLIAYSNMHPYWPEANQGFYSEDITNKQYNYEDMIRNFIEKGKLPYLSYDRYSLLGARNSDRATLDQMWFMNLGLIRGWAEEYEIPFWVCLQIGGFYDYYKAPTESEFLWLINTAIASGAKGIEYFPGVTPYDEAYMQSPHGDLGIVALDGQKTQYYYYSKKATTQIQAAQKYLMNAASVGIMVNPETSPDSNISNDFIYDMHDGYKYLLSDFRQLKSVSDNGLVGCFDYQGRTMLYVMNNSLDGDLETVKMTFDDAYVYDVIQRGVNRTASGKMLSLQLRGGEAALVLLR